MHLTFPSFTITNNIPKYGDLKVPIEPLTNDNWGIPNLICDGIPLQDEQLDMFATRLSFLDNVLKGRSAGNNDKLADQLFKGRDMTRKQRKDAYNKLQHALGRNFARDEDSNQGYKNGINDSNYGNDDDNNVTDNDARELNPIMNELPDHYLYEGSPGKMIINAFKELNIDDIWDFLKEESPTSKPFEKKKCAPPPRYYLESCRGDINDCLTPFQLQLYFGGLHLPNYSLLFKLGNGLIATKGDHNIPTIRELVNRKIGK